MGMEASEIIHSDLDVDFINRLPEGKVMHRNVDIPIVQADSEGTPSLRCNFLPHQVVDFPLQVTFARTLFCPRSFMDLQIIAFGILVYKTQI